VCFDATAPGCDAVAAGPLFFALFNGLDLSDPAVAAQFIIPVSLDEVHWVYNDDEAANFFGTPYGVGRNFLRGQSINNVDFGIYKNTKVTEKMTVQFQANIFNLFNRQFRGVPDPFIEDLPLSQNGVATGGSFMNTEFNTSLNRNMWFGLRFIF
jgi:hypothetical protein